MLPPPELLSGSAQLTGTVGNPLLKGESERRQGHVPRGAVRSLHRARRLRRRTRSKSRAAQIAAGQKQLQLTATYRHAPETFDTGRLRFQVSSNVMPLADIATLQEARPGRDGHGCRCRPTANSTSAQTLRVAALHADVSARNLQLTGQQFGDAHLTANTRRPGAAHPAGGELRQLGDPRRRHVAAGRRLPGQRHGHLFAARFRAVARVDRAVGLRRADRFTGFAEGELRIEGPALKPEAMKAELRLPKLEIGPTPAAGVSRRRSRCITRRRSSPSSPTRC